MSLFDKLFSKKEKTQPTGMASDKVIDTMLAQAESMLKDGNAERAVEQYKNILKLCPNAVAQYNLGSLYAQGKGTVQDLCEGAYYFRQAEKNGDTAASKMVRKCELDYMNQNLNEENTAELYERMLRFVSRIYPEQTAKERSGQELCALGLYYMDKEEHPKAAKLLRAAAEFCNDGKAQNTLGVLYNAGAGVEKNDLVSLYWFDRAADNGIAEAKTDRDGILHAYRSSLSAEEFSEYMERLACWCQEGTGDVPQTPEKVDGWRGIAQQTGTAEPPAEENPPKEDALSFEQQREQMVRTCMRRMPEFLQKQIRPDGSYAPFRAFFDYPGTSNVGIFQVEPTHLEEKPYAFKVGVYRSNTDLLVSSYMKMGLMQDIIEYLSDESRLPVLVSTFQHLSDSVDERLS